MEKKSLVISITFVFLLQFLTTAQEVRLEAKSKITIESGTTMVIPTGNLILESDATSDASLIVLGTVNMNNSGETKSVRYLPGSAQTWHLLGTPVNGMAISGSDFGVDVDDSNDFYAWYESSPGLWINYKNNDEPAFQTINGGDNFVTGKGYLIAYDEANPTKTFSGDLNTGDITFSLKNSGGGKVWTYESGWNLMSNPYSSSIDWNKADRTQFQDEFAYVYDPNENGNDGYVPVDGDNAGAYIGPNQGFFVISSVNNQNFTFTSTLQTHDGGSFLKSSNNADNTLILRLSSQEHYDETTIALKEDCNFTRDRKDAIKLYSYNSSVPQLYSISQDEINLAINRIPYMNAETPIPLGIRAPKDGSYTIGIQSNTSHFASNILYLEDKVLHNFHKLNDEDYQFTSAQGDINNRFVLHFGMTDIPENETANKLHIWAYNKELFVISNTKYAKLEIFDLQGRLLSSKAISINGTYSEMLNLIPGIYIVRIQNSNMVKSKQIILN